MYNGEYTFIGSGGSTPGIECLFSNGKMLRVADLQEGGSVYNLHYLPFDNILIAGCRDGFLRQYCWDETNHDLVFQNEMFHGAPVIAIANFNGDTISAGIDGKICVWSNFEKRKVVNISEEFIVSLDMVGNDEIVGIESNGVVTFWDAEFREIGKVQGIAPIKPYSLFELRYWPRNNIIFYPAENGSLAIINVVDKTLSSKSYENNISSVMIYDQELYMCDGGKIYRFSCFDDYEELKGVYGVVSSSYLAQDKLATINTSGECIILGLRNENTVICRKSGDYRSLMCISGITDAIMLEKKNIAKVEKIQTEILQNIDSGRIDKNGWLYEELTVLGYDNAVLALQAYEGQVVGCKVKEFAARYDLFLSVDLDNLNSDFIHRLISLAIDAGMVSIASDIIEKVGILIEDKVGEFAYSLILAELMLVDICSWDFSDLALMWTKANQVMNGNYIIGQGMPLVIPTDNDFLEGLRRHLPYETEKYVAMLLDDHSCNDIQYLQLSETEISDEPLVIVREALMCKESSLRFIKYVEIKHSASDDPLVRNSEIQNIIIGYEAISRDIVSEEKQQDIMNAIIKCLNERKAEI